MTRLSGRVAYGLLPRSQSPAALLRFKVVPGFRLLAVHGQWLTHAGTPGQESAQTYAYDKAGRLTTVADTTDVTCTRRTYGFNTRSDRTTQTSVTS